MRGEKKGLTFFLIFFKRQRMPGSPLLLPPQQEGTHSSSNSSSSTTTTTMPIPIRVPNNAHPNYGTTSSIAAETPYFSAREDSEFMSRLGSFTQSYSRASVLFMAENIPTPHHHHHHDEMVETRAPLVVDEEQVPFER